MPDGNSPRLGSDAEEKLLALVSGAPHNLLYCLPVVNPVRDPLNSLNSLSVGKCKRGEVFVDPVILNDVDRNFGELLECHMC